ncbi:MAG: ABC transporter ATP-binding protein [Candidatus Thermoplasmatota archaeon]|nr:ABC transporter ATP-binding protein [Euryarchaeota archaeon]MBU4031281.1 ABC transporter ATP-binding protein [Candidatus Thermoplasmatota archaeon]MBU4071371.1 ABC transporter ATP-binding protein [Candidatus Thermoplasmatota archaeon]MBU4144916.1 ABC transporter ATP-binding protein [Candidatus Thermoplasmatota archaeon]MBU4591504.1 ABC transporter ATP-binding protein [Candidatus Thermoplasmatota archaeon]
MADDVISVKDLVKVYDDVRAVDGITFAVEKGEVFAFLGPNGAGKTTTVEIIETIRDATSGEVSILGMDVKKNRTEILKRIGVLPQEFSSFDRLTVEETLKYYAALFCTDCDINKLIDLVNLEEHRKKLYINLSGGLKQRVGIAVSLVNDPEIIFLDEPTTGLDPRARHDVWEVIKGLKKEGKTIFLTTHYMEEAEVLADYIAIISKGKIIAYGTTTELIDKHFKTVKVTIKGGTEGVGSLAEKMGMPTQGRDNGNITIEASGNEQIVEFLNALKANNISYLSMDIRKPNLEELFLVLTGEALIDKRVTQ